jgi:peptide/nickel transport system permease protein
MRGKRILLSFGSSFALLLLIFVCSRGVIRALPGDPLQTLMAETGTRIPPDQLEESLHLHENFWKATTQDLANALRFQWGNSLLTQEPIAPVLKKRMLATLELSLTTLLFGLLISVPLGLAAAAKPGGRFDRICILFSAGFSSIPLSWLGPFLIVVGAVWIPIFPIDGNLIPPSFCLSLYLSSFWALLIRSRVREVLTHGAAPGARARGVPEWKVLLKYGLGPASGMLVAYLGTQFGLLLGGAIITESIFNWPGLGSLMVASVLRRDYPVVEATVFIAAAMCLLFSRLGELLRARLDPRPELEVFR